MRYLLGWRNRIRRTIACNHSRAMLVSSVDRGSDCLKAAKSLLCRMAVLIRPYRDNSNFGADSAEEVRRRGGATAVMRNLEYLCLQRVAAVQHSILSPSFDISSQQEIHRAVGDTQDH